MNITFSGRRALVTGAAHGIGRAIAEALALDGADVVAADILARELETLRGAAGGRITPAVCDLTRKAEIAALVETRGPFDLLVHSAGGVCGQRGRPLEEIPEADGPAILAINLTAAFLQKMCRPQPAIQRLLFHGFGLFFSTHTPPAGRTERTVCLFCKILLSHIPPGRAVG